MSDATRGASFYWTLPVEGDGPSAAEGAVGRPHRKLGGGLRDDRRDRFTYGDYLFQVARAAEASGFTGAFVPWNEGGDDSWIVAASLARGVRRLVFVPEVQPGFATPVYFAKMSTSFQRFAGDRLAWKVDLEREPSVRRSHGDLLEGDDWFARASEFVEATKGVLSQVPFNYDGRFYGVEGGGLKHPLAGRPLPPVFTAGRSDAALAFAARHADVHLFDFGPRAQLDAQLARLDRAAEAAGRTVARGARLRVTARHTDEEARDAARVATGLVGSYDAVARALDELVDAGIDTFVVDGVPRLEEAYRFGEHIFPRLTTRSRATLVARAA